MRIFQRTLLGLAVFLPVSTFAASTGSLSTEETLKQLILLVSQYDARIKSLEVENNILKNEMVKAGIKIPLSEYSGAIVLTGGSVTIPTTYLTGILAQNTGSVLTSVASLSGNVLSEQFKNQYGSEVSGFITRIQKEWKDIRTAYKLPMNANIGGYEFVQSGAKDHVFVDIVF